MILTIDTAVIARIVPVLVTVLHGCGVTKGEAVTALLTSALYIYRPSPPETAEQLQQALGPLFAVLDENAGSATVTH